ncbi:hypothetical protein CI610_02478 [invertebrate metagenome]|uniref:Uncharacterized protein n=1 Tax=invertebrate metagenome TaxID=1711999 RepID=A0A2H9T5V3_9ZZZZ
MRILLCLWLIFFLAETTLAKPKIIKFYKLIDENRKGAILCLWERDDGIKYWQLQQGGRRQRRKFSSSPLFTIHSDYEGDLFMRLYFLETKPVDYCVMKYGNTQAVDEIEREKGHANNPD